MASIDSTPAGKSAEDSARVLSQVNAALLKEASFAWKIHNTLAFIVEAIPEDTEEGLPTACLLRELRADMDELATSLGDLVLKVGRG